MGFTARAASAAIAAAQASAKPRITHVREFVAMGTQFSITVVDCDEDVLWALERRVQRLEAAWTRFGDSELMRANNNPDVPMPISEDTVRLVRVMRRGWELTDGLFDPNVLATMIDRGFAASRIAPEKRTEWTARRDTAATFADVELDEISGLLTVPSGVGLDAGGIGKGLAADLAVDLGLGLGARGVLVFAGGDLRMAGLPPVGEYWTVLVEDPIDDQRVRSTLTLSEAGIATSSPLGWTSEHGGHIVPKGGAGLTAVQATVAAGDSADAEILAKACLMVPPAEALELATRLGGDLLLVLEDGTDLRTEGWDDLCD